MKILVIGSGAREHALAWKLKSERAVSDVVCAPGNAGIAGAVRTVAIDAGDTAGLSDFAARERIDLTVVGPELPLDRGIADLFASRNGVMPLRDTLGRPAKSGEYARLSQAGADSRRNPTPRQRNNGSF